MGRLGGSPQAGWATGKPVNKTQACAYFLWFLANNYKKGSNRC
jgi:hypothetical protein